MKPNLRVCAKHTLLLLFFLAFTLVFINTAWLEDDIFITFRVVDNFLKGYGPVWNVGERVQVYTHPLWYALLIIGIGIFKHHYWFTLALSYVCLLATLYLFLNIARRGNMALGILASVALLLSRAFADYSSSGLENPLLHLLLCTYVLVAITQQDATKRFLYTGLLYSLLFLTRPDSIFLVTPVSLWMFWQAGKASGWRRTLKFAALAAAPALAWEAFSLIYYGSLVPNTAIAKTNLGYPRSEMLARGWAYLKHSFRVDPITLSTMMLAAPASIFLGRNHLPRLLMVGVALQLAYICWVGGDYMQGRFLTSSLLAAAIAITLSRTWIISLRLALPIMLGVAAASIAVLLFAPPPYTANIRYAPTYSKFHTSSYWEIRSPHGVSDQRAFYYPALGLLSIIKHHNFDPYTHEWTQFGKRIHAGGRADTMLVWASGMVPWAAGGRVHSFDVFALTDPFLARLLPATGLRHHIGHYRRHVPDEFAEALISGRNVFGDPQLAALYDDVTLAARAPLFSKERWKSIWRLNTGFHRGLPSDADRATNGFLDHAQTGAYRLINDRTAAYFLGAPPKFSYSTLESTKKTKDNNTLKAILAYENTDTLKRLLSSTPATPLIARSLTWASKDLWFLLISEAKHGQYDKLKTLLDAGADIRVPDMNGYFPLYIAARLQYADGIRLLKEYGPPLDISYAFWTSTFLDAARQGNAGMIELLVGEGLNVDAANKRGQTALMLAASHGSESGVNALLQHGANVNAADAAGETALMKAALHGHANIVKILINKEANVKAARKDGSTAFGLAFTGKSENILEKNKEVINILLAHDGDIHAALIPAARGGHLEAVEFLVSKGANINATDPSRATPLMQAASRGHKTIVAFLLDKGANANLTNRKGYTPLMEAAFGGHEEVVKLLLAKGVYVDTRSRNGVTALGRAASKGRTDVAKLLIKNGANIDAANNKGLTPLMAAAWNGHVKTVKLLLAKGARVDARSVNGFTALGRAASKGRTDVARLLLKKGAPINVADNAGQTPLMEAALRGHADTMSLLLKSGADFRLTNKKGETALQLAEKKNHLEVVSLLKNAGATE